MASITKQAHCANNPSHHDRGTRRGQINYPVQPWAVGNPYPQTGKQRAEVRLRTRHARGSRPRLPSATCWQQSGLLDTILLLTKSAPEGESLSLNRAGQELLQDWNKQTKAQPVADTLT